MSILGVDLGKKRIGLAMGTMIAEEYKTLKVQPPAESFLDLTEGTRQVIDELWKIIKAERIETIVVGIPESDGTEPSKQAKDILAVVAKLKEFLEVPIETVDESLTSFAAEEILKDEGATIEETKARVDQVAAKLILQQYLEEDF